MNLGFTRAIGALGQGASTIGDMLAKKAAEEKLRKEREYEFGRQDAWHSDELAQGSARLAQEADLEGKRLTASATENAAQRALEVSENEKQRVNVLKAAGISAGSQQVLTHEEWKRQDAQNRYIGTANTLLSKPGATMRGVMSEMQRMHPDLQPGMADYYVGQAQSARQSQYADIVRAGGEGNSPDIDFGSTPQELAAASAKRMAALGLTGQTLQMRGSPAARAMLGESAAAPHISAPPRAPAPVRAAYRGPSPTTILPQLQSPMLAPSTPLRRPPPPPERPSAMLAPNAPARTPVGPERASSMMSPGAPPAAPPVQFTPPILPHVQSLHAAPPTARLAPDASRSGAQEDYSTLDDDSLMRMVTAARRTHSPQQRPLEMEVMRRQHSQELPL